MNIREYLKLYFIMGSNNCVSDPVLTLEQAIQGGITLFQFREKGEYSLQGEEKIQLARQLKSVCHKHSIPFIVNDDLDLAILLEADGIHIGQDDIPIEDVREKVGSKIIGLSCHNEQEAKAAIQKGADYIGVGPMFETNTKPDAECVTGPITISQMRSLNLDIPIVGIGGITPENAPSIIEAGADGIAIISAISKHPMPLEAARQLLEKIKISS
ncbi:thiamine phosphate synthase [Bacillus suaedaesalsae]|uniref:Thiamine-phosphate synthase n=1 Tax=Bacillus suaedaesalsae TaxID=2810349 RepID=A0ABS2DH18_9BACI|nr:thiamine phosphate synthase [Bacillus suaedaesalsae]MBM6617755.1 thiamine phosphate synthase [Bacillus suaedaesalsae]